jgi:hypothetical protein
VKFMICRGALVRSSNFSFREGLVLTGFLSALTQAPRRSEKVPAAVHDLRSSHTASELPGLIVTTGFRAFQFFEVFESSSRLALQGLSEERLWRLPKPKRSAVSQNQHAAELIRTTIRWRLSRE